MKYKSIPPISIFDIKMKFSEHKGMHRHDFHELFLTLNGSGKQYTPQGIINMKKGDIFIFPAGVAHIGNGGPAENCVGGVINFYEKNIFGDFNQNIESFEILKILAKNAKKGNYKISITKTGRKQLFSIFYDMLEESKNKKSGYKCMLSSLMHQFFIAILRNSQLDISASTLTPPITVDKINDTIQFIKNHFTKQVDIDQAAQMANMSRSYFHANFKKVTGKTYIRFLNDLRVESADRLLKTSKLDTEEIAFRSGFTSVSHFYKVFKEATGISPKKIRKTNKTKNFPTLGFLPEFK